MLLILHYQGRSRPTEKNLPEAEVSSFCAAVVAAGWTVEVIDCDGLAGPAGPIAKRVARKYLGDCSPMAMARAIAAADAFVGIDSGPGHLAGMVPGTRAAIVWRGHHPAQYYGLCHVTHFIEPRHGQHLKIDPADPAPHLARDQADAFLLFHQRHRLIGREGWGQSVLDWLNAKEST